MAREQMISYAVVKDLLDMQTKHNESMLAMLGIHLEKCAELFEKALNPDPVIEPISPFIEANPRMSEEEEDLRYSRSVGDITDSEFEQRLSKYTDGAYID